MTTIIDETDPHQAIHRLVLWSPIATRFSPLEVCALLGASLAELRFLGSIDLNTLPAVDLDDPSMRAQYYNFWGIARIALHRRLRVPLRSDSVVDDWVRRIEDELQESLEVECSGQVHLHAVEKFGRSALQFSHTSLRLVSSLGGEGSVTESWVRSCYARAVIEVSKSIVSLLSVDGGMNAVTVRHQRPWNSLA